MRWLASLLLLLVVAAPAAAQTFPPLEGKRVVDAANVIPDDREAAISAKLKGVEDQSGRQFVVATIPSLQGYPPEDYGYRLGREWGIGQKGENNGLILLVAPNDRKVRIEVGYGLEPIMTDALSSIIINTQILPRFKAGDLPGGIVAGVDAIVPQLTLPADQAEKRARLAGSERRESSSGGGSVGSAIFWLFLFLFVILPILMRIFRKRGRRYGGGIAPVVIWGPGDWGGGSSFGGGGDSSFGDVFSGGGGSFGGGGASGDW